MTANERVNPFLFDTGLPNNCAARLCLITHSQSPRILKTTQRDGLVLFHFYLVIFIIINDIYEYYYSFLFIRGLFI